MKVENLLKYPTTDMCVVVSQKVQRMIELCEQSADEILTGKPEPIDGWIGISIDSDGSITAGRWRNGIHYLGGVKPEGKWLGWADALWREKEIRELMMSMKEEEIAEFRKYWDATTATEMANNYRKKNNMQELKDDRTI